MRDSARAVIIGGGVAGTSIAYHLTAMGWTDVVVLDRGELTSGSTFHSAGLVGQLRSSVSLTRMMMYGVDLYGRLLAETGRDPGWRQVGSLRVASSAERLRELERQAGWALTVGLPLELISAAEAQRRFPLMSVEGVLGAAYLPTDGHLDPSGLALALAEGARRRGARVLTGRRVRAIRVTRGRIASVDTDDGPIDAPVVVDAAGIWAPEIGRLAGVTVPIVPMAHQYLTTAALSGVSRDIPTMRDPDRLVYFREEVGGLLMGGYERHPAPWALDGIPADFNHKLLAPDWERFEALMASAVSRVPDLERAEVTRLINGPEAFTPDGEFILGEAPGVRGFFVAAGFCAHGIAGAGGVGRMLAEWIVDGRPSLDLWRMDIRRFGAQYAGLAHTLDQTVEVYSTYYDIHYPFEERRAGRDLKRSPAWERLRELGCEFGEKAGWERPNWFEVNAREADAGPRPSGWAGRHWSAAIEAEHRATRGGAALYDETSFAKIEVAGRGALRFLQRVSDNDLERPPGAVIYTQLLNERGGIECDLTVTRLAEDRFFLVTGSAFGLHDVCWIRSLLATDDEVEVRDVSEHFTCFGLWGPVAREILARVTTADLSTRAFPYPSAREIEVGGVPVRALRVTYVGELGWELYAPMADGLRLWDLLWDAGRPSGLVAAGYRALDTLRLEKGYRYWSAELTPEHTPWEAGLDFCVKLGKGEFIGRAALAAQKARGVGRRLACLVLDSRADVALGGEPVLRDGEVVGRVTSGGVGHSVGRSIAYAYVPVDWARPGERVAVMLFGQPIPATVTRDPLYDPRGDRIRA